MPACRALNAPPRRERSNTSPTEIKTRTRSDLLRPRYKDSTPGQARSKSCKTTADPREPTDKIAAKKPETKRCSVPSWWPDEVPLSCKRAPEEEGIGAGKTAVRCPDNGDCKCIR